MRRIMGLLGLALLLGACGGSPDAARPPLPTDAALVAPTTAPAPTSTTGPTNTPKPTSTPRPTDTPAPTKTPTPIPPTATPVPPVVLSGHGKTVTDPFIPPSPLSRVIFTHNGRRNFAVTLYVNNEMSDLLVNTIGAYQGSRPILSRAPVYLEINADGDWTATIEPIPQDDTYAAGAEGSGDFVSDLFQPAKPGAVPFTFSHDGKRNFAVWLRCAGGEDLVANEIGTTSGAVVVQMQQGPCLWDVQADGAWSLKPK